MGVSSRQVSVRDASARARRLSAVGGPGRPSDGKAGGQGWRTRTPYPVGGVSGQVPRSRPLTLVVVAELVHRYMMVTHDGDPLVPARSRRGRKRTRTGHPPTVCMQSAHPGLPVAHAVGSLHSCRPATPLRVRPLRATRGVRRCIIATSQPLGKWAQRRAPPRRDPPVDLAGPPVHHQRRRSNEVAERRPANSCPPRRARVGRQRAVVRPKPLATAVPEVPSAAPTARGPWRARRLRGAPKIRAMATFQMRLACHSGA